MTLEGEQKAPTARGGGTASYRWAPRVVLLMALAATALATHSVSMLSTSRDQLRLAAAVLTTTNLFQQRLGIYSSVLQGGTALFAATGRPSAAEFRRYVETLGMAQTYPGIQGIGFAQRVLPGEVSEVSAGMRELGFEEFRITPEGERAECYPIVFLHPLDRRNRAAIGYDMFAEPVRNEAMARARDEGRSVASGKVQLVQEIDPEKQPGFLLYAPVYQDGEVPETQEARRERIRGFVYSPFRAYDLFKNTFPKPSTEVTFDIYDGDNTNRQALLYRSNPAATEAGRLSRTVPFTFAGHRWTMVFQPTAEFTAASHRVLVPWVLCTGLVLSALLFLITLALSRAHRKLQSAEAALKEHVDHLEETVAARTKRLSETIAELQHMSYSIVHDMRAPLRAIQSFGLVLEEEAGPRLTAECRDYLDRMRRAAGRMDALIRDVLRYGNLVQEELPLAPLEVSPLVRGIVETYPNVAEAEVSIAPDIPAVLGNEAALTQCFSNLLGNAVKFKKPGSKPVIAVTAERRDGWVRVCVKDNGVGIPREMQPKVFDMFQRLDNSKEGTGIGLAIVRKAAERMGGGVYLESEPGEGTRFYLKLRPAPEERRSSPPRPEPMSGSR